MDGKVLIVDDSLTVRMDLADAFAAAGIRTLPCATIAEARAAMDAHAIGLVILDALLPDGDGIDFLREIRSGSGSTPIILLSTEAEVRDRIRGLQTGVDAYIGKPYDTNHILAKARNLLRLQGGDEQTIFVIDDSPTFRTRLQEALEAAGYTVVAAPDGNSGLALLTNRRPAALIVDGVMPDMDGATFIRHLRLDAAFRAIPCLLLTASDEGGAQLRALDAGADAFVSKDEDLEVILARLDAILRRPSNAPVAQVESPTGPRKILAVDDSTTYLQELAAVLRDEGYEVSLAKSGEEALDLLAVQPVDCILMDLIMPGIGGKEACRRIKSAAGVRDIPVILLTAVDDRNAMLEGLTAGADDYISKSSEFEVLKARVRTQIRRKQFEDENRHIRDRLLRREVEAAEARAARELADSRVQLVAELERRVEARTNELKAQILERRQAERMASVGMLAASVAHEINNPLAVVSGNLDIIVERHEEIVRQAQLAAIGEGRSNFAAWILAQASDLDQPLKDSQEAADRVRQIVRDLRMMSRPDDEEPPRPVDLHKVLESTIRMASTAARQQAHLTTHFGDVPLVLGDDSRLGQVFLALIVNATQAMPEGQRGEIRISTRSEPGDLVFIEVADDGVGIPADELSQIFEPFYTTKPAAIGTGLGLAICRRIMAELGGEITVESEVGVGTTFRVVLHAAGATAPATINDHETVSG